MSDPSCTDPSIPSACTDLTIVESVDAVPPSDASLTNQSAADQVQGTDLPTAADESAVDDATLQDKIPAPVQPDIQSQSNDDQTDAESSESSSDEESSICQSEMVLSDYEEEKDQKVLKTKNEIPELPPIEPINVEIPVEEPLIFVGRVDQIIQDNLIIIAADNSGDYQVLDMDSVLLTKYKKPIGKIFEVFGRVQQPLYSVRVSGKEEINELELEINTPVYYIENLVQMVLTQPLKAQKGSDASNLHDEEVGENEAEFSDDEKEAEHKRLMKKRKSQSNDSMRISANKYNEHQRHPAPNQNVNRNIQGYNYQYQQFQQQSVPNSHDQYAQYYYQIMQASFNQQAQQFYNYQANPYPYGHPQGLYNPAYGMGSGSQNSSSITNQHIANQEKKQEQEEGEISLYDNIFQQ